MTDQKLWKAFSSRVVKRMRQKLLSRNKQETILKKQSGKGKPTQRIKIRVYGLNGQSLKPESRIQIDVMTNKKEDIKDEE